MMSELSEKKCVPCEGGIEPLAAARVQSLLSQLQDWQQDEPARVISKTFQFKGFGKTMAFVNAVAWIANQEGHHPDMEVGYDRCVVHYTTHAAKGLTENDFICAAKIDALFS